MPKWRVTEAHPVLNTELKSVCDNCYDNIKKYISSISPLVDALPTDMKARPVLVEQEEDRDKEKADCRRRMVPPRIPQGKGKNPEEYASYNTSYSID